MFNFLSKAEEPEGGRGVATGVYRYMYLPKISLPLKMWLFSCDPGQIRDIMFTCGTLTYFLKL